MIVLKINSSKAKEFAKLLDKSNGKYIALSKRLQNWLDSNPGNANAHIVREIKLKLKHIICETPKGLELIINDFHNKGYDTIIFNDATGKLTGFGADILKIFNYKSFRQSKKALWFAKATSLNSCTICNTQYTLKTNQAKGEKLLFHLDHYFPKSVYPYLSLSYHNLIPCCSSCNMSKSNKPFTLLENIHPYVDSFHEIAKFKLDRVSIIDFLVNPNLNVDKIDYNIDIRAKYYGNTVYETKLKNYLREFRIPEQYVQFKDVAAEMILKSRYYQKARKSELRNFFEGNGIEINDELFKRLILGNYHQDKDILKRPLAKFMKDIGEDLLIV